MWLLDPVAGGRRRALVRDRGRWLGRKTSEMSRALAHDVGNRVTGLTARARHLVGADEPVSRDTLLERVPAKLGPALQGGTRSGFGTAFRPARWSPTTRALAGSAVVAGAAVALSMTMARARRRRLEADLPPPF
jgi:hypothetical protein